MPERFRFRTVIGIGWIPFKNSFKADGWSGFHVWARNDKMRLFCCQTLFASGNDLRPAQPLSEEDFSKIVASREYRGCLLLRNIDVWKDADENFNVELEDPYRDQAVGYTPYRLPLAGNRLTLWYEKGVGRAKLLPVIRDLNTALITYQVRFRIRRLGYVVGRMLTGYWPPSAEMTVGLELPWDGMGNARLYVTGTSIPSQHWTICDKAANYKGHSHDMESIESDAIDACILKAVPVMDAKYKQPFDLSGEYL